jgi:hypothetical protein
VAADDDRLPLLAEVIAQQFVAKLESADGAVDLAGLVLTGNVRSGLSTDSGGRSAHLRSYLESRNRP